MQTFIMPEQNDDLTTILKNLAKQIELLAHEDYNSSANPLTEQRAELIARLQMIVDKARSGYATSEDLKEAKGINAMLGDEFFALIAEIEDIVKQAEAEKHAFLFTSSVDSVIAKVDQYFAREDIKASENTLREIEAGRAVSLENLIQTIESVTSTRDREAREQMLQELELQKKAIYKTAIVQNRITLTDEERESIAHINTRRLKVFKRDINDRAITDIIGEHTNAVSRAQAILENKPQIERIVRAVAKNFHEVEHLVAQEDDILSQQVAMASNAGIEAKQTAIAAVDTQMAAVKTKITRVKVGEITETAQRETKPAEVTLSIGSSAESEKDTKADQGKQMNLSRKSKLEALKATKAIKAQVEISHLTEAPSNCIQSPNSSPNTPRANSHEQSR